MSGRETGEGNFPFTARENAADRGVAAVKPAPRSLRILSISRLCLDSFGWKEDRRERRISLRGRVVLSICTASRIGGGRMVPLMCAEVRKEKASGKNTYTCDTHKPGIGRTREESPGEEADEHEGEKRERKEWKPARTAARSVPREKERRREGERVKDLRNKLP